MFKNMKFEINATQSLDKMVRELNDKGYEKADQDGGNVLFVVTKDNGLFYFVGGFDVIPTCFKPTTLAELKEINMNERELFEEAFKLENPVLFAMLIKGDVTAHNCYEMSWRMWQASANRQGYKFVPVDELSRKVQNIRALNIGEYASDEIEGNVCGIEAMIGDNDD